MPIGKLFGLTGLAKPLTSDEGRRILERDQYRCQYCGLDGLSSFENSLVMTVDFIHPRARKGKKDPANLVTACRPCNVIKGERMYRDLEHAKSYVLQKRDELRKEWEATKAKKSHSAKAGSAPSLQ
jgi:5-methylcytosine-specific restriction endonuclease McrA